MLEHVATDDDIEHAVVEGQVFRVLMAKFPGFDRMIARYGEILTSDDCQRWKGASEPMVQGCSRFHDVGGRAWRISRGARHEGAADVLEHLRDHALPSVHLTAGAHQRLAP